MKSTRSSNGDTLGEVESWLVNKAGGLENPAVDPLEVAGAVRVGVTATAKRFATKRVAAAETAAVAEVKATTAAAEEFAGGLPATTTRSFVPDLSHVTGSGPRVRNRMIQDVLTKNLPGLKLTYRPQYNPFLEPFGVAASGQGTQLGKLAFSSRLQLIETIVHEELHHRWWARGLLGHHGPLLDPKFEQTVQRYLRFRGFIE